MTGPPTPGEGEPTAIDLPPLPDAAARGPADRDPLQARLREAAGIEVPVHAWPRDPAPRLRRRRLLRVSAHLHNDPGEYAYLADVLAELLAEEGRRGPGRSSGLPRAVAVAIDVMVPGGMPARQGR